MSAKEQHPGPGSGVTRDLDASSVRCLGTLRQITGRRGSGEAWRRTTEGAAGIGRRPLPRHGQVT
ncbi:hypothetical protein DCS_03491 [Drechmeria coniospora]|uniref:Uncharacterized protein n=1 Tax=Drechmeria coniospora TaxID=98403 RepID=A0A151GHG5_DRECN|nr:hypothetical protein DCS_03491 [Drechmeria coniospora]KYK56491.1 hypothetical protein DCS_03491 [Drechmeria coniospora]